MTGTLRLLVANAATAECSKVFFFKAMHKLCRLPLSSTLLRDTHDSLKKAVLALAVIVRAQIRPKEHSDFFLRKTFALQRRIQPNSCLDSSEHSETRYNYMSNVIMGINSVFCYSQVCLSTIFDVPLLC